MRRKSSGGRGVSGKIFYSLFLLPFLLAGLYFTYLMVQGLLFQFETYSWPRLTCTILSSHVEENPGSPDPQDSYIFQVRYRWSADFAEGTSDVYRHGYFGSSDIGEALRLARTYAEGSEAPCWVNPDRPNSAILEFESAWNVLWIFFPLLFVAVGGGGIFLLWKKPASRPSRIGTAISSRASVKGWSPGCLTAFFSVFLFAGLAFFIPFFLLPLLQSWTASDWPEVPCLVEYSSIRTHRGDDSTTYSVDVLYSYDFEGERYKSSRYDFFSGSDSEYKSKNEFVEEHPAGTRTSCFVNPDDPLDAVLRRGASANLIWGILPLIFVAVGGTGVAWSLKGISGRRTRNSAPSQGSGSELTARQAQMMFASSREFPGQSFGPLVLKPAAAPLTKLLGGTFIALVWNGIVGLFVWQVIVGWDSGEPMGCLALFLIPFVLIGLLLLINIPYQALAMFNPRPELTLERSRLTLGEGTSLTWRFRGAARRIRRLRITLEGTETVTYRQGTNTRTDSRSFATIPVVDAAPPQRLDSGQAYLEVPADTMHSFEARHNKVHWRLMLQGEIRGWPDILEVFEIQVEPPG